MIKNYLTVAIRSLRRQKLYTIINFIGLTLGLTCFLLIAFFIRFETGYDKFHQEAELIYRIEQYQPGQTMMNNPYLSNTAAGLAGSMMQEFPEIDKATTFGKSNALLGKENKNFLEDGISADSNFFNVFSFPLKSGNLRNLLNQPNTIVLTKSLAEKLFGNQNPVGQTLIHQNWQGAIPYQITGVIEDVPAQSHFTFSYITSIYSNQDYLRDLNYTNNNSWKTYIKVNLSTDITDFQSKLPAFVQKFTGREDAHEHYQYYTKALTDIHLRSKTLNELSVNGDIKYVYFFGVIAIVILLLACTNYTNLATARSLKRAREVGMRKVLGASRQQIAGQFLGESILLTALSLPVAVGLAHSLLPGLGKLLDRPFDSITIFENFWLLPILAAIAVFTGLVAGSYPAFFMSALLPSKVLKDQMKGRSHSWLRSALIVGQFAASVILITGSILVYQQLQFVQQKEMGYQKEQIIIVPLKDRSMDAKLETIKTELLRNSGIQSVSVSSHTPANIQSQTSLLDYEGRKGEEHIDIYQAIIDQNFINLYDLKLVEGENIPDQMPQDSLRRYLINETAAKALGWASPIGKRMRGGVVVGVLKDFHMHDLHQPIAPLMLYGNVNWYSFLSVKINTSELPQTLAHIENTIKQASNYPFEFQFFDEFFNKMYQKETRLGTILGYFTIISLIIAALGLFGIAAYTAENRTKEIGIRKILGATVSSIMLLLSKDFSRLVLIALFIGAPLGYLLMRSWLNDFAYRIQLSWVLFAMTSILAMLVAIMAVSFQAYKAANANPVRALRNE